MVFIFTSIELINKENKLSINIDSFIKETGVLLTHFEDEQVKGEFSKFKGVNQYGQSINSASLSERDISIEGIIIADNREQIEVLKRQLVRILNPLYDVLLKYNEDHISKEIIVRAEEIPAFSADYKTNNENGLAFQCSLNAPYPFWQDQKENVTNVETWEGGFEFEFEIPSDGIEFAKKGPNEIEFINYGDIDSPLEIFFNGPALNPVIKLRNDKVNNKEAFIKLNKRIQDNETLYISTAYGNKKVEIIKNDGIRENAYNYIDIKSTLSLFNLEVGTNILSYKTDGDFIPQSVIFKYKDKYLSL